VFLWLGSAPVSLRLDRNRTVAALISYVDPAVPSCGCKRGPPVLISRDKAAFDRTLLPFVRYWLQVSACFPQTETRNQIVSHHLSIRVGILATGGDIEVRHSLAGGYIAFQIFTGFPTMIK
jgi:hypothetical protein